MVQTRSQKQAEQTEQTELAEQDGDDDKLMLQIAANVSLVIRSRNDLEKTFASRALRNSAQIRPLLNNSNLLKQLQLLDKGTTLL
jgi:hypothetical protein